MVDNNIVSIAAVIASRCNNTAVGSNNGLSSRRTAGNVKPGVKASPTVFIIGSNYTKGRCRPNQKPAAYSRLISGRPFLRTRYHHFIGGLTDNHLGNLFPVHLFAVDIGNAIRLLLDAVYPLNAHRRVIGVLGIVIFRDRGIGDFLLIGF